MMIKNISVLGAGTMGHCIAETFAIHGYEVALQDTSEELCRNVKDIIRSEILFLQENGLYLEKDISEIMKRITVFTDLEDAVTDADYVIEAVFEDLALKQELFKKLDRFCKKDAILASNTSTLPLQKMIAGISEQRKKRVMVNHWYNPAHIVPIAELSFFGNMDEGVYEEVAALYKCIGKQVVKVKKDIPGLIANRIQQAIAREVFSLIEQDAADPEDIERALTFGPAFRYATTGQLTIADFGGIDIWTVSLDNILPHLEKGQSANLILKKLMKENKLGFKTGEGFFKYPEAEKKMIKENYFRKLIKQAIVCRSYTNQEE